MRVMAWQRKDFLLYAREENRNSCQPKGTRTEEEHLNAGFALHIERCHTRQLLLVEDLGVESAIQYSRCAILRILRHSCSTVFRYVKTCFSPPPLSIPAYIPETL